MVVCAWFPLTRGRFLVRHDPGEVLEPEIGLPMLEQPLGVNYLNCRGRNKTGQRRFKTGLRDGTKPDFCFLWM